MTPEEFVDLLDTIVERVYYDNGQLSYEEYLANDELHRVSGPAFKCWHPNGQLQYKQYYVDGKLHRLDGPAFIGWNPDGYLEFEDYYIDDTPLSKEEFEKVKNTS